MFLDTGIGKDGYSIIGQGKIDEILSSKSEERRAIFEEASGIMKYKVKKEEATKKLILTDNNLSRVNDIISEIELNLKPLEEKSIKAKKYLEFKNELKKLDVNIFLTEVKENALKLTELDDKINTYDNDIKQEEIVAIDLEKAKLNIKERIEEIDLKQEEYQNKYYQTESENQRLNSNIDINRSKIVNNEQNNEILNQEIEDDKNKIDVLKSEISSKDEKKESLFKNKIKFEEEYNQKEKELNDILVTLDEKGKYIEDLKLQINDLEDKKNEKNILIASYESTIDSNNRQLNNINNNSNNNEIDKLMFEADDIVLNLNDRNNKLVTLNKDIESLNIENTKIEYNKIKEDQELLKKELMTLESKYVYLNNLVNENEGYFKSVKNILDYAKDDNKVYGTVSSIISTDEKYEKAIEVALGGFIQNVVVQDETKAKELINHLKDNLLGRVTFLPLNTIQKVGSANISKYSSFKGFLSDAISLVKFDKKFIDIVNLALNNTIIVDNLDNAYEIYKKDKLGLKIVTIDGEIISKTGSITGGNNTQKTSGLIGRDEKIKSLKILIDDKQNILSKINTRFDEYNYIINEKEEKLNELKNTKESLNIEIALYNEKLENNKMHIKKIKDNNEKSIDHINNLSKETEKLKLTINNLTKDIEDIDNIIKNKNIEIDEYTRFNKDKQQIIDYLNEDIVNLKISLSSFDESSLSIDEMVEKLKSDIFNFEQSIVKKNTQIENNKKEIVELESMISDLKIKIEELNNFNIEFNSIIEKLKIEKKECSTKLDTLELKMLESVNRIVKIKEEKSKIENKKIKYDIELDTLKNKMWDEYELTISSAKEYIVNNIISNTNNILKQAEKIRNDIKQLGDIDVSSINEYENTKNRYDFITAQKKDLDETKNKLENLISNMTSLMKTQFMKQFKIINDNFNKTFTELFGGGKAELKLTDESNVLESGIEIDVQPPGKKLQSMMLLSRWRKSSNSYSFIICNT
jgi:chromosome segregation protein